MQVYTSNFNDINEAIYSLKDTGGRVIVDKSYISSTITFYSNIELHILENCKITLTGDYNSLSGINYDRDDSINVPTWENCEYNGKPSKFFICGSNLTNVSITGKGIINGNEEVFYGNVTQYHIEGAFYPRVPLIYFENCKNLKINDITLEKSAFWTVHLVGCDNIEIDNLTINNNLKMTNCDGIDPDHCKNVKITNCNISCADDCIVFKNTEGYKEYGNCENIYVSNCNLTSTSAAIKFGTESVNDFSNITLENINITASNRAISLQLRDCGNIYNCKFNNINIETRLFSPVHWWGRADVIAVTAVPRNENTNVGKISDISFNNIKAISEGAILIYGNVDNINLSNIDIEIVHNTKWKQDSLDLRPSIYGVIPNTLTGIYLANASNIIMDNVEVKSSIIPFERINIINCKNVLEK